MNIKFIIAPLLIISVFTFMPCLSGCKKHRYAEVYETTGDGTKRLERQRDLEFAERDPSSNASVIVDAGDRRQIYRGCGAAMTHSSARLLTMTDEKTRSEILRGLFSREGAYFTNIRLPVGASDYIAEEEFFSCDDTPNNIEDRNFDNFTLDRDAEIIAVLKEVLKINPDVNVIAVPWSAPGWMKNSGRLVGGSLKEGYEDVFAGYLLRFVKEYAEEGIKIGYVSPINEPQITEDYKIEYPFMTTSAEQLAEIVVSLGKLVEENGLDVKIAAYEHNYYNPFDFSARKYLGTLASGEAAQYLSAITFHTYAGEFDDTLTHAFKFLGVKKFSGEIYLTETTEVGEYTNFGHNLSYALRNVVLTPAARGSSMSLYWNYVLTSDGKPILGNAAWCTGLYNLDESEDGWKYSANSAYYAMAHISAFVRAESSRPPVALGAKITDDENVTAAAFLRADGKIIVVVHNKNYENCEAVDVVVGGERVSLTLSPLGAVTLVVSG